MHCLVTGTPGMVQFQHDMRRAYVSNMDEWQAGRDQMIDTCASGHSRSFALDKPATADAHLKAVQSKLKLLPGGLPATIPGIKP